MELDSLTKQIVSLRWEKDYSSALDLFRKEVHGKFSSDQIKSNPRLVSTITDCLKETGRLNEAITFVESYLHITEGDPIISRIGTTLGWLYFFALNPKQPAIGDISSKSLALIANIIEGLTQPQEAKLFELLLIRLIDSLMAKPNPDWEQLQELSSKFPPQRFSIETATINTKVKGKDKMVELASNREKWFMLRSKIAYSLGNFEECIDICQQALDDIDRFHYGNQHWLTRRIALSYQQLGQHQRAIHELEKLLNKRKEWFIQRELAELYHHAKEYDKALDIASLACLNGGHSEFKTGLFELMGDILLDKQQHEKAALHYQLAVTIRNEQGWRVPESLTKNCKTITQADSQTQYDQLRQSWKQTTHTPTRSEGKEVIHAHGTISRILHSGENGDGFITTAEGQGVYFRFSQARIPFQELKEGLTVSFKAKQVERNGKMLWNATQVFLV